MGAVALVGMWALVPLDKILGSSDGLDLFLTALGLLTGTSVGWLGQYLLRRPMTREMLTGPGWAVAAFCYAGLIREAITGPWALAHLALIVAYSGALAWGVRLLVPPMPDELATSKDSRTILVDIKLISHAGEEVTPRPTGHRTTPVSPLLHSSAVLGQSATSPKSKDQKAG